MSELEIKQPELTRDVMEYEFVFDSGMSMPIIVDTVAGDSIDLSKPDCISIQLAAKMSPFDPNEVSFKPEAVTIYKYKLACVHVRTRTLRIPSPDELFELRRSSMALAGGTH
jgi:hypothetical protein